MLSRYLFVLVIVTAVCCCWSMVDTFNYRYNDIATNMQPQQQQHDYVDEQEEQEERQQPDYKENNEEDDAYIRQQQQRHEQQIASQLRINMQQQQQQQQQQHRQRQLYQQQQRIQHATVRQEDDEEDGEGAQRQEQKQDQFDSFDFANLRQFAKLQQQQQQRHQNALIDEYYSSNSNNNDNYNDDDRNNNEDAFEQQRGRNNRNDNNNNNNNNNDGNNHNTSSNSKHDKGNSNKNNNNQQQQQHRYPISIHDSPDRSHSRSHTTHNNNNNDENNHDENTNNNKDIYTVADPQHQDARNDFRSQLSALNEPFGISTFSSRNTPSPIVARKISNNNNNNNNHNHDDDNYVDTDEDADGDNDDDEDMKKEKENNDGNVHSITVRNKSYADDIYGLDPTAVASRIADQHYKDDVTEYARPAGNDEYNKDNVDVDEDDELGMSLPYGIQNVRKRATRGSRPALEHHPKSTTYQSLCPTKRVSIPLETSGYEYRPNHYIEITCAHNYSPTHTYDFNKNKICSEAGFSCIQLNRTIHLIRRNKAATVECWESEIRIVPSGCECMWPKHSYGDIIAYHEAQKRYNAYENVQPSADYQPGMGYMQMPRLIDVSTGQQLQQQQHQQGGKTAAAGHGDIGFDTYIFN